MKHVSLIIDPEGKVLTQYEVGYMSMIDTNRSLQPKHPKDVRTVIYDPDMLGLPVGRGQSSAYSLTMLNELDRLQPYMDVRTPAAYWKSVEPEIVSVWVMGDIVAPDQLLASLDLPQDEWELERGPSWRITNPPSQYPYLANLHRLTLTRKAYAPLPFPA